MFEQAQWEKKRSYPNKRKLNETQLLKIKNLYLDSTQTHQQYLLR